MMGPPKRKGSYFKAVGSASGHYYTAHTRRRAFFSILSCVSISIAMAAKASNSSLTPVSPASLPRFIALQSTSDSRGYYLTIDVRQNDGLPYLTFSAKQKTRLIAHEVVFNVDEKGVFMLRAPNGRFWQNNSTNYILANAGSVPRSPASDPSCYFRAFVNTSGHLLFQSVLDDLYLIRHSYDNLVSDSLKASATNADDASASMRYTPAADFAVVLPHYVMLLGNNDKYVANYLERDINWLKFNQATPDLAVANEIIPLVDGNVAIFNLNLRKFWRRSPNWIWLDVDDSSAALNNKDCHYDIIKLSNTMIAFKCVANDGFLRRYTEYWEDCLCANGSTIDDPNTHLRLREAVLSRKIFNVKYLLALAEVNTDVKPLVVGSGTVVNNGNTTANMVVKVAITREVSNTQTWTSSTTFSTSVTVGFTAGIPEVASVEGSITLSTSVTVGFTAGIPEVASVEGSITLGAEYSFSTEMGSTRSQTITFETSYEVKDVQPKQEATVTVECTMAKCRIPFTYTSKDTRIDGIDQPPVENVDGIFEGVNAFNIRGVVTKKDPDGTLTTSRILAVPVV